MIDIIDKRRYILYIRKGQKCRQIKELANLEDLMFYERISKNLYVITGSEALWFVDIKSAIMPK